MNREQKRALEKRLRSAGRSAKQIRAVVHMEDSASERIYLKDGEKVKINVAQIRGYKVWPDFNPEYQKFVEANADTVFTVMHEKGLKPCFICFEEDARTPKWLFYERDLVRVS